MKNGQRCAWFLGLVAVLSAIPAWAEVKLPAVLSSHMVLQRDMAVPVWGTAAAGEKVTVKFRTQEKSAVADDKGNWLLKLDALQAGGPDVMTVAGTNTLTLDDVLVGEVWVGSGQSNMDMPVTSYTKGDENLAKMAAGTYPKLRLIRSGNPGWAEATPENIEKTSALLFSFGQPLQQKLDVPVGLLVGAVGGTPSGYWLTKEMYESDAACKDVAAQYAAANPFEETQKQVQAEMAKYDIEKAEWDKVMAPKLKALQEAVAKCDAAKTEMDKLKKEQQKDVPEAVAKYEAAKAEMDKLKLEQQKARGPRKPAPALHAGESNGKIGHLYEAKIQPFVPFAIRGVLWDQGESGTAIQGIDQYTMMGALIRGWRKAWGQGDFPFLYVQKPSGSGCAWDRSDPVTSRADTFSALPPAVPEDGVNYRVNYSGLPPGVDGTSRETFIRIMQYPNTAMVTSSDLGPGIHPSNKSGYGARACRVALGLVYGQKVEIYGPVYQSHTVEGSKVRISYTHVGQGLAFKNGDKLQGFAVAGKDLKFVWADAAIDGATVVVSSPAVAEPVAVRYAWSERHPWANLFNKDGLPAIPFRTDK